jgi:hypothetical protein
MIAANESTRQPAFEMGDSCVPETEQHHSKPDTKMKTMKIALSFAAAVMLVGKAESADSPIKPNIIYILADDLGYGDVQCLNPQRGKIKTPNLDRLATQGITFTEAHAGASVCTPTRYGILTGRYAWRTRLQRGVLDDYVEPLIASDRLTVPELLKQQGYATACIGKWHLGFTIENAGNGGGKKKAAKDGGKFAGHKETAKAGADGKWLLKLMLTDGIRQGAFRFLLAPFAPASFLLE